MVDESTHVEHPEEHQEGYLWISDFVYGGIDGAVTTFAVVAGVEGASLSIPIILILGFANLFADGLSMAAGKYSSDKAELEQYKKIREMEYRHLEQFKEHETEEVREIMSEYGFKGQDLENAIRVITSDADKWVDLMMKHEFNLSPENVDPIKGAAVTYLAFILIGLIPLMGYVLNPVLQLERTGIFILTIVSTFIALFVVGAVKSRFTMEKWFIAGVETALIGGAAAAVSYGIGFLLRGLA